MDIFSKKNSEGGPTLSGKMQVKKLKPFLNFLLNKTLKSNLYCFQVPRLYVSINSTVNQQKMTFSDPTQPPLC